jgi:hypothetical protein
VSGVMVLFFIHICFRVECFIARDGWEADQPQSGVTIRSW